MSKSVKKWHATGVVSGGKYLGTVEGRTKEEAIEAAWASSECYVSLCHQCTAQVETPEIDTIIVEEKEDDQ